MPFFGQLDGGSLCQMAMLMTLCDDHEHFRRFTQSAGVLRWNGRKLEVHLLPATPARVGGIAPCSPCSPFNRRVLRSEVVFMLGNAHVLRAIHRTLPWLRGAADGCRIVDMCALAEVVSGSRRRLAGGSMHCTGQSWRSPALLQLLNAQTQDASLSQALKRGWPG